MAWWKDRVLNGKVCARKCIKPGGSFPLARIQDADQADAMQERELCASERLLPAHYLAAKAALLAYDAQNSNGAHGTHSQLLVWSECHGCGRYEQAAYTACMWQIGGPFEF